MTKTFLLILIFYSLSISNDGEYYFQLGIENKDNLDKANDNFNKALIEFVNEDNEIGIAKSYYYLGFTYDFKNDFKNAINFYYKSSEFSNKINEEYYYFYSNLKIASILRDQSIYSNALFYLDKIKKILNEHNKKEYESVLNYNYSFIYFSLQDYDNSILCLNKINIDSLDNNFKKKTLNLYGLNYTRIGRNDEAYNSYIQALELFPSDRIVLLNLIKYFYENNMKDSINNYFGKYLNSNSELTLHSDNVHKLILAEMYFYYGKYEKSIELINESLVYFTANKIKSREIEAYELINKNYVALEKIKDIASINDKISKLYTEKQISSIEISSELLKELVYLENENNRLEAENRQTKSDLYIAIGIIILLLTSIYSLRKYYITRKEHLSLYSDVEIQQLTLNRLIKMNLNNLLNKCMKSLVINYEFDENKELYQNLEDVINTKNDIEAVLDKSKIEIPQSVSPEQLN